MNDIMHQIYQQLDDNVKLMFHNGVQQAKKLEVRQVNYDDNFFTYTPQEVEGK